MNKINHCIKRELFQLTLHIVCHFAAAYQLQFRFAEKHHRYIRQQSFATGSLIKLTNVRHCLLLKHPIDKKRELERGEEIKRINPSSKFQFLIHLYHWITRLFLIVVLAVNCF